MLGLASVSAIPVHDRKGTSRRLIARDARGLFAPGAQDHVSAVALWAQQLPGTGATRGPAVTREADGLFRIDRWTRPRRVAWGVSGPVDRS